MNDICIAWVWLSMALPSQNRLLVKELHVTTKPLAIFWNLFSIIFMAATKSAKTSVKANAMRLIKHLPEKASWDDVMYELYVRRKIEAGLEDIKKGRVFSHDQIKSEFGLA